MSMESHLYQNFQNSPQNTYEVEVFWQISENKAEKKNSNKNRTILLYFNTLQNAANLVHEC